MMFAFLAMQVRSSSTEENDTSTRSIERGDSAAFSEREAQTLGSTEDATKERDTTGSQELTTRVFTFTMIANSLPVRIQEEKPMNTTVSYDIEMITNTFTFTEMVQRTYNTTTAQGGT